MKHLKRFDEKTGWLDKSVTNIKKLLKGNSSVEDALEEYNIETQKIDNYNYKYYHNGRLVARIFQPDGEEGSEMNKPVFKLYFYLYDKEIPNNKNWKMKQLDPDEDTSKELSKQPEKPYYKLAKKSFSIDWLIQSFYEAWATKTISGRKNSQKLNMPSQKGKPMAYVSPTYRRKGISGWFQKIFK
jgi:hypothetical protein